MTMMLGKRPPKHDMRIPLLSNYIGQLPPAPLQRDLTGAILSPLLNDRLSCCTISTIGHILRTWSRATGTVILVSDQDILLAYERACGYNPKDPNTDQGGVETDVLTYWLNNTIAGRKLAAFAALQPNSHEDIRDAVWLFGGCYTGFDLPISCQSQDVWSVPPGGPAGDAARGSWGGHAVPIVAYNPRGVTVITWGTYKQVTWEFVDAYMDEAYALLSHDWIKPETGISQSGFHFESLQRDIGVLRK